MSDRKSWEEEATWPRMISILGGIFLVVVVVPLVTGSEVNGGAVAGLVLGAVLAPIAMYIKKSRERERREIAAYERHMRGEPAVEEDVPEAFAHPPGRGEDS